MQVFLYYFLLFSLFFYPKVHNWWANDSHLKLFPYSLFDIEAYVLF